MKEYDIYLLIDTLELKVEKISDSLLIGPTLTDAQCQQLMHKPDVIVKLYDGKHCFITMFPNVFTVNTQEIVNLTIGFYKDYFGHLVVHYAHWGFRYGSEKIYPCKRYKGQFDR